MYGRNLAERREGRTRPAGGGDDFARLKGSKRSIALGRAAALAVVAGDQGVDGVAVAARALSACGVDSLRLPRVACTCPAPDEYRSVRRSTHRANRLVPRAHPDSASARYTSSETAETFDVETDAFRV